MKPYQVSQKWFTLKMEVARPSKMLVYYYTGHSITTQKTLILIFTAMKISYLTSYFDMTNKYLTK